MKFSKQERRKDFYVKINICSMEVHGILTLTTGGINAVLSGCFKKKISPVISKVLLRSNTSIHTYVDTTILTCVVNIVGVDLVLMIVDVMVEQVMVVVILALDV